ncbi:MAG: GNVR domain-containing protein [Pseudomonadales bacterium]
MTGSEPTTEGNELQKIVDLAIHYAYGVWNYRWYAVAVTWAICLVGWTYVYLLPNTYGASATVYVDTDSVLKPLLRGLSVESDVMNEVGIMTRTIVSRPNLEAVGREIDLDVKSKTPAEYERRLVSLESRIDISRDRQGLYKIAFQDTNRDTALTVVKSLLDTFVEDTLGSKTQDSTEAEATLQAQIKDYEQRLTQAEDKLKNFKRENVGMMPGEAGDYYQQLQTALSELESVKEQLRIEQQKRAALQRQIVGEEPVFGIMTPVAGLGAGSGGSALDGQIAELEQKLASLSLEYTDKHPEVIRTRSLLEELKQRRQQELASRPPEDSGPVASSPLDLNPVYQNMKIQLSDVQVQIASLQATLQERQANVDRLKNLVDVIPQVEAELTRLNRDYDVVQARYQEMLERWENLKTSQRVGTSSENVKFRIIDPPFAPTKPVGPPRGLFLVGVFVVALGMGVGVAILFSLLRPVFFRTQELNLNGYAVLGSIARISTPELERRRIRLNAAFAASVVGVVGVLGLVAAFAEPASEQLRRLL